MVDSPHVPHVQTNQRTGVVSDASHVNFAGLTRGHHLASIEYLDVVMPRKELHPSVIDGLCPQQSGITRSVDFVHVVGP